MIGDPRGLDRILAHAAHEPGRLISVRVRPEVSLAVRAQVPRDGDEPVPDRETGPRVQEIRAAGIPRRDHGLAQRDRLQDGQAEAFAPMERNVAVRRRQQVQQLLAAHVIVQDLDAGISGDPLERLELRPGDPRRLQNEAFPAGSGKGPPERRHRPGGVLSMNRRSSVEGVEKGEIAVAGLEESGIAQNRHPEIETRRNLDDRNRRAVGDRLQTKRRSDPDLVEMRKGARQGLRESRQLPEPVADVRPPDERLRPELRDNGRRLVGVDHQEIDRVRVARREAAQRPVSTPQPGLLDVDEGVRNAGVPQHPGHAAADLPDPALRVEIPEEIDAEGATRGRGRGNRRRRAGRQAPGRSRLPAAPLFLLDRRDTPAKVLDEEVVQLVFARGRSDGPLKQGLRVGPLPIREGLVEIDADAVDLGEETRDAVSEPRGLEQPRAKAVRDARREWIRPTFARLRLRAVEPAQVAGDMDSVVEPAERVRQPARLLEARPSKGPQVIEEEPPVRGGEITQAEPVLMFRDALGMVELQSAEVKEHERPIAQPVDLSFANQIETLVKVPVGGVVAAVPHDADFRDHARDEVDPLLVGEEAFLWRGEAVPLEPVLPPSEEVQGLGAAAEPQESEVVTARNQEIDLGRAESVRRHRREGVRREDHVSASEGLARPVQGGEDEDVRVEEEETLDAAVAEQVVEEKRFDGRVELGNVVLEGQVRKGRDLELLDFDDLERFLSGIERPFDPVDQENEGSRPGVMPEKGFVPDPREADVVLGDDRAGGDLDLPREGPAAALAAHFRNREAAPRRAPRTRSSPGLPA